jgi:hypothetical protein
VALHNQLVYSAALVPALAVGLVKLGPGELPKEERDALHEFLGRNRWVIEYAIVTPLAASVLQFHAEPWKIKRWGSALFAYLVFRFRGANISIRLTNEVAVEKIEDASRWDEGHHRRQGPFGHAHPA